MSIELDDLETRLREMYAVVAETTVVDDPVMDTVPATRPEPPTRRRVALLVAAAVVIVAAVGWVVARRGDAQPAGPMDGRPFAIPLYLPEGFGLDGTALIDDRSGPPSGMEQTGTVVVARTTWKGPGGQIIWVESAAADELTATATGETARLDDGTVAQWDDGAERLAWTLPTGQAVSVSGTEVSQARLISVASNLWYVDRATWDAVTAKVGYVTGDYQRWRIPGKGTDVDVVVSGSLRSGFRLQTGQVGWSSTRGWEGCLGSGAYDVDQTVVYVAPPTAATLRVTDPAGGVVVVTTAMAPGLPQMRWAAVDFPGADERWIGATDHSKGCTAVIP